MTFWRIYAVSMAIAVYMLLALLLSPPASRAVPLQYGEWCYWEKGLAKLRLARADASVELVPLN